MGPIDIIYCVHKRPYDGLRITLYTIWRAFGKVFVYLHKETFLTDYWSFCLEIHSTFSTFSPQVESLKYWKIVSHDPENTIWFKKYILRKVGQELSRVLNQEHLPGDFSRILDQHYYHTNYKILNILQSFRTLHVNASHNVIIDFRVELLVLITLRLCCGSGCMNFSPKSLPFA